jgi:hypothetical protein
MRARLTWSLGLWLAGCGGQGLTTPWSEELTRTVDDLAFLTVPDLDSGQPTRLFAVGYDTHDNGPWDGQAGPGECFLDAEGVAHGYQDSARELNERAVAAGANFAYVWSGRDKLDTVGGRLYGIWHPGSGESPPPDRDALAVVYNGAGEADMAGNKAARAAELAADFQAFRERSGRYAPEATPRLPPYAELPWYAWHPTWRIRGQGSGTGEECSPEEADAFAGATSMMIGDNYTYVTNRFESWLNPVTGQKGEQGEGYDLWLERDDPEHRSYFAAAWNMIHSAVTRARGRPADPAHPTVVWAWMQGHAFDDDIGRSVCFHGSSDLWARGPFPTAAYLRKEIASTIAAGGTGIIFFGSMYCREPEASRVRAFFEALSHPEVYGPALLSPRLDLGRDLAFFGPAGHDGQGRLHLMLKWDAVTHTAYLIGANPGARATPLDLELPWSLERVERLDWGEPSRRPAFATDGLIQVNDRRVRWLVPRDDGFILRLTPWSGR